MRSVNQSLTLTFCLSFMWFKWYCVYGSQLITVIQYPWSSTGKCNYVIMLLHFTNAHLLYVNTFPHQTWYHIMLSDYRIPLIHFSCRQIPSLSPKQEAIRKVSVFQKRGSGNGKYEDQRATVQCTLKMNGRLPFYWSAHYLISKDSNIWGFSGPATMVSSWRCEEGFLLCMIHILQHIKRLYSNFLIFYLLLLYYITIKIIGSFGNSCVACTTYT